MNDMNISVKHFYLSLFLSDPYLRSSIFYPYLTSYIFYPSLYPSHMAFLYHQTNVPAIKRQQNMKSWKENYLITQAHLDTETQLKGFHTLIHTLISGLQCHSIIIIKEIYVKKLAFMF